MAMNGDERKAAIAAYKERKRAPGIYAVRDAASGQVWVGRTQDLEKIENRIWFGLRCGGHPCRALQAAWSAGEGRGLAFERLEALEPEESRYILDSMLKERLAHWRSTLGAALI
jgi:hypothetical protein